MKLEELNPALNSQWENLIEEWGNERSNNSEVTYNIDQIGVKVLVKMDRKTTVKLPEIKGTGECVLVWGMKLGKDIAEVEVSPANEKVQGLVTDFFQKLNNWDENPQRQFDKLTINGKIIFDR